MGKRQCKSQGSFPNLSGNFVINCEFDLNFTNF